MSFGYLAHVFPTIVKRFGFFFVVDSLESVDEVLSFYGWPVFLGELMRVWTVDGLGVLAGIDFFLAENLGMGAFMRVVILEGVGDQ